jgi:hypothetical protein
VIGKQAFDEDCAIALKVVDSGWVQQRVQRHRGLRLCLRAGRLC